MSFELAASAAHFFKPDLSFDSARGFENFDTGGHTFHICTPLEPSIDESQEKDGGALYLESEISDPIASQCGVIP